MATSETATETNGNEEKSKDSNGFSLSSSFITNPPQSLQNPRTQNSFNDDTEFDSDSDNKTEEPSSPFQSEVSSFESPAKDPPLSKDRSVLSHSTHDFQTSSFLDDTRGQFDLDIDINKVHRGKMTKKNILQADRIDLSVPHDEELVKRLTDCKIQLKLYQDILKDLVSKNQIDVADLTELHDSFAIRESDLDNHHDKPETDKLETDKPEADDMASLVEDLYASLEESQTKWRDADRRAASWKLSLMEIARLLNISEDIPHDPSRLADAIVTAVEGAQVWEQKYHKLKEDQDARIEAKLSEYQARIDELQREADALRDLTRTSVLASTESLSQRDLHLQKALEEANRCIEEANTRAESAEETSAATIASLTNQLNNRKKEVIQLKTELHRVEDMQGELQQAAQTELKLKSEKIKLSHQVETLSRERDNLKQRMNQMQTTDETVVLRRLKEAEETFQDLFAFDVDIFTWMIGHFGQIGQDASLAKPRKSLESIETVVKQGQKILSMPSESVVAVLEHHGYLARFIQKATEKLVVDYLSCFGELDPEQLMKSTPRKNGPTKTERLRIEELTVRLKRERETRKYENDQAKTRFGELEAEIVSLRGKLAGDSGK